MKRLVDAAELKDLSRDILAGNIMVADTYDAKGNGGSLLYSRATGVSVSGARLGNGKKHTLNAVPPHFCRDRVLDYIQTEVREEKREGVAKAVFNDLSGEDLKAYGSTIRGMREENKKAEQKADEVRAKQPSLKNRGEAKNIMKLESALGDIDCTLSLEPASFRALRRSSCGLEIFNSAVAPNQLPTKEEEAASAKVGGVIDQDCDQIRATIARLIRYGNEGWTIESFRKALGVERAKMVDFLQRRGPHEGLTLGLFELALEFFKTRELLRIPLPSPPQTEEEVANDKKRKREPLEERAANVIEKSAEESKQVAKARKVASDPEDGTIDWHKIRDVLAGSNECAVED